MKRIQVTEVYTQDQDSCGPTDALGQDLELSTEDAGGGHYVVIKTERWAVDADEIDIFAARLRAILERVET